MLVRECAGAVAFYGESMLLLHNEKGEWVLPKDAVREGALSSDAAREALLNACGVEARILGAAGETMYEFYSITRRMPMSNRVVWYIMETDSDQFSVNRALGYDDGGFFSIDQALERVTYSGDRALLGQAWARLRAQHGGIRV